MRIMARARRPPTQAVSAKISPAPCAPRRKVLPVPRRPRPRRECHLEAVAGALMLWRTRRHDREHKRPTLVAVIYHPVGSQKADLSVGNVVSRRPALRRARGARETMARASVPSTSISPSPCSRIFPRRPRAGTGRRAVRAPRARSDGDVGDGGEDAYAPVSEEELRAAVEECRELLREATRMAGEQARAELTASFLSVPEGASGLTGNLAVDMARVQLFFQGKGMRAWEAEKTSRTLVELDSIYGDVELLAVKYDRLVSTLPDVDVKAMVANDPSVMGTEIKSNVERMLRLGDIFPARKVPRLLAEAPKLLTCGDLEDRVARTVDCIKRVYPKETDESCMYAVRETKRQSREKSTRSPPSQHASRERLAAAATPRRLTRSIGLDRPRSPSLLRRAQLSEEPSLLFDLPDLSVFEKRNRIDIAELPMTVQEMLVFATRNENE